MAALKNNREWRIQLKDVLTCELIDQAGGVAFVCEAGKPNLVAVVDPDDGTSATNPVALNRGTLRFATSRDVQTVDLYIQSPTGHFTTLLGYRNQKYNEVHVNTGQRFTTYKIPLDHALGAANTEINTGIDIPKGGCVLGDALAIEVATLDATETVDVGTNVDADGFMSAVSVETVGLKLDTNGVLVNKANGGMINDRFDLTFTMSAGSDTFDGFAIIPMVILSNEIDLS